MSTENLVTPFILRQRNFGAYLTLGDAISEIAFPQAGLEVYIISEDAFYYYDGSSWIKEAVTAANLTTLENKLFNVQYFEIINSGTSGTLTPPQGGSWGSITSIAFDQFGGGIDIFVSQESGGYPTGSSVEDVSTSNPDDIVAATLDASGNWSLVGTPVSYPIALVYYYQVKLKDLNVIYSIGGLSGIAAGAITADDVFELQQQQARDTNLNLTAGRNANVTNSYLRGVDGNFMNQTPFVIPYDAVLTHMSASTSANETWTAQLRSNGVLIPGATLTITGTDSAYSAYNINIPAGSKLSLYCNGTAISNPRVDCIFKRK